MQEISQIQLKNMLILGGESLAASYETINSLNVFPVPDGDTGTNMNLTIQSGVKSIISKDFETHGELTKTFSKGLLLGARGNSGVILSQFFRGFNEGMENVTSLDVQSFLNCLKEGQKRAYSSVIKAVEGTILTVIKDMANFKFDGEDFLEFFEALIEAGQKSLDNTPNLLPVLKEVGVVDSGGAGLLEIFKGMYASLTGKEIESSLVDNFEAFTQTEEHPLDVNDIIFGYCTEMLIQLKVEIDINDVRAKLESLGDSIVAIEDDGILKVHVHTETPMEVFKYGKSLGDFVHIKSENMRIQAIEAQGERVEVENGIVAVCSSEEMAKVFSAIHTIEPIIGGQTLNPSIESIVKAIKNTNAKNVLVFPNNSNVIMAAKSAKDMIEDKNVEVIETKYMTQCFEALLNYNPEGELQENKANIEESFESLVNYEVSTAIKDTKIDNIEIRENDFLLMKEGKIVGSFEKEEEVFQFVRNDLDLDEIELFYIFSGADANDKLVNKFIGEIEAEFEFLETSVYKTNQSVYPYLISALKE